MKTPASPFESDDKSLWLPRDRREINSWARHYYATNPTIATFIDEIANQVYSDFVIFGKDNTSKESVEKYRDEFLDGQCEFKFKKECIDLLIELNEIGEVTAYAELDEDKGNWSKLILHNPDYIEVRQNTLSSGIDLLLIPDEELKRLVDSKIKKDIEMVKSLDKEIVEYIKEGKSIPLNSRYASYFALKSSSYDIRGTSRIAKYFKILLHEDKLREESYEKNTPLPQTSELNEAIRRVCVTKAFENSLKKQRNSLREWIENKLFNPYGRIQNLKGSVGILWNEEINMKSFEKMWK